MGHFHDCLTWFTAVLMCVVVSLAGATDHSSAITEDDCWVAAGNPHVIVGNVTVAVGAHLLIGPGVEVQTGSGSSLVIEGYLAADGDPGNEIRFTWSGTNSGPVTFTGSGSGNMDHCIIGNANTGVELTATAGTVTVFGSTVRECASGIRATGGSLRLASTTFIDNSYGLVCWYNAPQFLDSHVLVTDNSVGIRFHEVPDLNLGVPLEVRNSTSRGIWFTGCSLPFIDNVTLAGNAGHGGLYFENCGDFMLGAGNVIGGAGQENSWPVTIMLGSYPAAGCVIPATGNLNNDIKVDGGISSANGTWRNLPGLDYVIAGGGVKVSAGGTLTIEPGVSIRNEYASPIIVEGTLVAAGAQGQEIIFTREADGFWGGIIFQEDGSGSLTHCVVERASSCVNVIRNAAGTVTIADTQLYYGVSGLLMQGGTVRIGSTSFSGGGGTAGIQCEDVVPVFLDEHITITGGAYGLRVTDVPGLVLITPLVIRGATQAGVYLVDCLDPVIDHLVVTECTGPHGAFYMYRCGDFTLGFDNVIGGPGQENSWPVTVSAGSYPGAACIIPAAGNTNNDIRVYAGTSAISGTWRKFSGLDYVVAGTPTVAPGGSLAIEPGVQVRFAGNFGIGIQGVLQAVGAHGQEIVFTRNGTANWANLNFLGSGSGTLDHCIVEYASNGVYQTSSGTVTIADSILRNGGYGIRAAGGTIELKRNLITGNTEYGVHLSVSTPLFGTGAAEWNDIHGNGAGRLGRDLRNGAADIAAPFIWWGSTDPGVIASMIYDHQDEPTLGVVEFTPYCDADHVVVGATGVGSEVPSVEIPIRFDLAQGTPNPFNPSALIRFDTTRPSIVRLTIHDVAGRTVATLVDEHLAAGRHRHTWNGCDDSGQPQPSGVYFSRLESAEGVMTRKLAMVR